jgi:hypothetical protein
MDGNYDRDKGAVNHDKTPMISELPELSGEHLNFGRSGRSLRKFVPEMSAESLKETAEKEPHR